MRRDGRDDRHDQRDGDDCCPGQGRALGYSQGIPPRCAKTRSRRPPGRETLVHVGPRTVAGSCSGPRALRLYGVPTRQHSATSSALHHAATPCTVRACACAWACARRPAYDAAVFAGFDAADDPAMPAPFRTATLQVYVLAIDRFRTRIGDVAALWVPVVPPSLDVQVTW